jgi:polyisoprenoid-binding protein YceI
VGILLENKTLKKGVQMKKILFLIALLISSRGFCVQKEIPLTKENGKIIWNGKKITGEHFGEVQISNGKLKFESGELRGGQVQIDMKSITCEDLKDAEYNKKLVNHLKSDDFFSTEKYPTAIFEISSVKPAKGATYEISGNLDIKGISKPATLKVLRTEENGKFIFKGNLVFDRTQYDIRFRSKRFFESLGDKVIYDDVTLSINLYFPKDLLKN